MTTNQEGLHATVRALTSTTRSYNEDWHALFDSESIAAGPFNARMLAWINATLGTSYTNLTGAMQAFAVEQGFANWASMNTFTVGYPYVNAEAEAIVSAFTSEPDDTRKGLIDTLVGSLKTAGIWTEIDAMFVLAAHDSQAALLDWKNPGTRSAVAVNAPTFVADRGYTSDGSTSRLRTNYTPSTNAVKFTQNSASLWAWSINPGADSRRLAGAISTGSNCAVGHRNGSNVTHGILNSNVSVTGDTNTSAGLAGISRVNTTVKLWMNGTQSGSDATHASAAVSTQEQWMCGANASSFALSQVAAAIWASSLTGKEAALHTTIAAYMTGVGA